MAEWRFGTYQMLGELGRGGMGTVFRARRTDLPQFLAIKVLGSAAGRQAVRFAREQEILARLDHPAIVRWLDSGRSAQDEAFYVMELVDGLPIDRYCAQHRLGVRARIELFLEVCAAVSHAHQHLVVHRDLKPANVLVDRDGRPRLLDFGIAKWLDGGEEGADTTRGASPMTLLYASPEQVRGEPVGVGTDVYSLAVMLFELLTGHLPHPPGLDLFGLAVAIDRHSPPLASKLLRQSGDAARARILHGDLDAILAKGLAKSPAQRYASVGALAADLRRYLEHQPVSGSSRWQAIRHFVARHRLVVGTVACLMLVVAATAAVFFRQAQARRVARSQAELARAHAEARVDLLDEVFAEGASTGAGALATVGDALDVLRFEIERKLTTGSATGAAVAATAAEAYWRLGDRPQAGELAAAALASGSSLPARELGGLLAIELLARPAPSLEGFWLAQGAESSGRRAAIDQARCDLAPHWEAALAAWNGAPLAVSLASELAFSCAIERWDLDEARRQLERTAGLRKSLPADHPASRDLEKLRAQLAQATARLAEETLP